MAQNRSTPRARDGAATASPPSAPARPVPGPISSRALSLGEAPYLAGLNTGQRAAVETVDGPVLVLAGAGTGKTRVLTTRIAHILASGRARPSEILAVTFTNKAAREMKERIGRIVGGAVEGMPWLGTFHSIGVKILRRHHELAGLKSGFTILDTDDQIRLLKQVIEAADIDKDRWPARQLANLIDGWKNRGLTPEKVPDGERFAFANGKGADLYAAYQTRLKELNAADFGDLLLENLRIFLGHPDVLADWRRRFRYILVDEYQDTNVAQYLWLRLLAPSAPDAPRPNLCVVGDDDQCLVEDTTVTMGDGSSKALRDVAEGEQVLSCYGSGDFRPADVLRVHRKQRSGTLIKVMLASGTELVSTPEHVHFAGYRLGLTPQTYFVYLMQRRGFGYRLGTSQVHTKGQKQPVLGYMQRSIQEHADALWIVSAHDSENDARFAEQRLSLTYGIPTIPFVARKGKSTKGIAHDQAAITRLFESIDTEAAARRLLEAHGLSPDEPHHQPQSRNSIRRNVTVTLCGDRRGATPMHRLSVTGNDQEGADRLRALGFSVRPAKKDSASWRVETAKSSWHDLRLDIGRLREAFPISVIRQARLGADNLASEGVKATSSLPFRRAASIRPGMAMFTQSGYDLVTAIERVEAETEVIDIDVKATHNFVGNGIVTHNSIYGWRGAEVDNILRFDQDFPGAAVVRLEENYRSTGHILAAASHLIANNAGRLGKTLHTTGDMGAPVTVTGVWDDEEEARVIGEDIEQARRDGEPLNGMAILVRASYQMRVLEDRFVTLGLPYRVIGGPRFYERQEIKDAIAYLEVTVNPANDLKFERIVNVPKRGLGDTTVKRIHELARGAGVPMFQAARAMTETEDLTGRARRSLADLVAQFDMWRQAADGMRHTDLAERILDESGYTAMWQADRSPQAQSRLENLKELVRFMDGFESLAGFLEHVSLVMDTEQGDDGDRVSIMTLHGAKGLEFDTVFLPAWEEGAFPSQRTLDESGLKGLEEERRLAYVGLTRARRLAKVSFAQNRRNRGLYQSAVPSRFVDELPEANVTVIEAKSPFGGAYSGFAGHGGGGGGFGRQNPYGASRFDTQGGPAPFEAGYDTPGWQRAKSQQAASAAAFSSGTGAKMGAGLKRPGAKPGPRIIEGELVAASTAKSAFKAGERVFHDKFGYGRITQIEGNKLTVDFEKAGEKKVVDSFVERV